MAENQPAEPPDAGEAGDDTPLSFDSPESSVIDRAEYCPLTRTLKCYYKRSEKSPTSRVYVFADVPLNRWMELVQAPSKGAYFNRHIRPLYSGKPVELKS